MRIRLVSSQQFPAKNSWKESLASHFFARHLKVALVSIDFAVADSFLWYLLKLYQAFKAYKDFISDKNLRLFTTNKI